MVTTSPSSSLPEKVSDHSIKAIRRGLAGSLMSGGIALLAYRRHSLSRSGALGATATGTAIVGLGGWAWGMTLVFFFVSSSLLSHYKQRAKEAVANDKFSKGSQRDLLQVIANGGVAVLMTLGAALTQARQAKRIRDLFESGFVGAFATANADTWATEIGTLSTRSPRLITTGRVVTPGTSGGLTLLGTAASTAAAFALGLFHWLFRDMPHLPKVRDLPLVLIAGVSGVSGSLFDSVLGATVQAIYYCPTCDKETERRIHNCGTQTTLRRGIPWVDNDVVNFAATLFGGFMAMLLRWLTLR